jgi:AcrR family transcriptional regulator
LALTTQRHLTREDWVAFARKTLVQSGIDDVKIDRLATRMKVSRGSFYWHFQHRKDLLDALLQDWEVRNLVEIAQVRDRWARARPDLSEVIAIWLGEDPNFPAFDTAVRFWARKSPAVADACHRVDAAWIGLLEELFRQSGYDAAEGLVRARIVYFHQIGYYALAVREDMADRLRLVPLYYKALTGSEPGPALEAVLDRVREAAKPARKTAKKTPKQEPG